jgi:predicted enzyme related to lactoylglutathione lyase
MNLRDAHVHKIGLFVKNFERALLFYKNNLGLVPVWVSPEGKNAGFRTGGCTLIVQEDPAQSVAGGARLYFSVLDARGQRDQLVRAGVSCEPARNLGFGVFVEFSDPDGNRFALFQPSADYLPQMENYLGFPVKL